MQIEELSRIINNSRKINITIEYKKGDIKPGANGFLHLTIENYNLTNQNTSIIDNKYYVPITDLKYSSVLIQGYLYLLLDRTDNSLTLSCNDFLSTSNPVMIDNIPIKSAFSNSDLIQ